MKNVLLVGNGFDLAHGLHTSYGDFLKVMKNRSAFNMAINYYTEKGNALETSIFYDYFKDIKTLNEDNIIKLQEILETNSWVKYFSECEAEIDGWIDFEREIYPVIDMFETIFKLDCKTAKTGTGEILALIHNELFHLETVRIIGLWSKYVGTNGKYVFVQREYTSMQYGILKKKILQSLRDEFDEFIKAFEIYLLEFVYGVEHTEVLKQIKDIKADYVISFNYTRTERLYNIQHYNAHHLHGLIKKNLVKNNMVVGVNEQKDQSLDFIYFVKYFQRIQKATGIKYKEFVKDEYTLHVYGHSLDETDEDILKYVIGNKTEKGDLFFKPYKVFIYYYDASDYEQKVINLIKLYGRSIVEEYMEKGLFRFIPIDDTKCAI